MQLILQWEADCGIHKSDMVKYDRITIFQKYLNCPWCLSLSQELLWEPWPCQLLWGAVKCSGISPICCCSGWPRLGRDFVCSISKGPLSPEEFGSTHWHSGSSWCSRTQCFSLGNKQCFYLLIPDVSLLSTDLKSPADSTDPQILSYKCCV